MGVAAERGGSGGAQARLDLVKRNRARRITLSTALQQLQQLVDGNPAPALVPEVVVERDCMMCLSARRHVRLGR